MSRTSNTKPRPSAPVAPERAGSSKQVAIAASVAFLVAAVVFGLIGWQVGRPDSTTRAVAALEQADLDRDQQQTEQLIATARQLREQLTPVLEGIEQALPVEGAAAGPTAPASDVQEWREVVEQAAGAFESPPSAGTGVNLAREALQTAVEQVAATLDTYAVAADADASGGQLLEVVAQQRDIAIATWGVAATQIDLLSIEHDFGHTHIYLDSHHDGALHADSEPEGR